MKFRKVLEKIRAARQDKLLELERSLVAVEGMKMDEDPALNPTMRLLDDSKECILDMAKTCLIIEMPLSHSLHYDFSHEIDPNDIVYRSTGPFVWDAINEYLDKGNKIHDAGYERRLSLVNILMSINALPKEMIFADTCAPLPIRMYLKYYPPELVEWRIGHYLEVKDSTKQKYVSQFRRLVDVMSQLETGHAYESNEEAWKIAPSIVSRSKKRKKKDVVLACCIRAHYFARMVAFLEDTVLQHASINRSAERDLLVLLLLFYSGLAVDANGHLQVSIQELSGLKISQIGFKRGVIHFSKCNVRCPKSYMKLLMAYTLSREEYVFRDACESSQGTSWLNKRLSEIQDKFEGGKNEQGMLGKIVPSTIQKSALHMKRSLLLYVNSLDKTQILQNCKKAGEVTSEICLSNDKDMPC